MHSVWIRMVEHQFSGSAPHYLVLCSLNQLTHFKIADLQKLQLSKKFLTCFQIANQDLLLVVVMCYVFFFFFFHKTWLCEPLVLHLLCSESHCVVHTVKNKSFKVSFNLQASCKYTGFSVSSVFRKMSQNVAFHTNLQFCACYT